MQLMRIVKGVKMKKIISIVGILLLVSGLAVAHSGRTDSSGGHKNTKTGTYHYHGSSTKSSSSGTSRNVYNSNSTTVTKTYNDFDYEYGSVNVPYFRLYIDNCGKEISIMSNNTINRNSKFSKQLQFSNAKFEMLDWGIEKNFYSSWRMNSFRNILYLLEKDKSKFIYNLRNSKFVTIPVSLLNGVGKQDLVFWVENYSELYKKNCMVESPVVEEVKIQEPLFDSELEVLIEILNVLNEINDKIKE